MTYSWSCWRRWHRLRWRVWLTFYASWQDWRQVPSEEEWHGSRWRLCKGFQYPAAATPCPASEHAPKHHDNHSTMTSLQTVTDQSLRHHIYAHKRFLVKFPTRSDVLFSLWVIISVFIKHHYPVTKHQTIVLNNCSWMTCPKSLLYRTHRRPWIWILYITRRVLKLLFWQLGISNAK